MQRVTAQNMHIIAWFGNDKVFISTTSHCDPTFLCQKMEWPLDIRANSVHIKKEWQCHP